MARGQKMLRRSRIVPKSRDEEMDSVKRAKAFGGRRDLTLLMESVNYYNRMAKFREERERNKKFTYGDQWCDKIQVDGKWMSEEDYIKSQGNVPLKNNQIRILVKDVVGVYRKQNKEPVCVPRDKDEQSNAETMTEVLRYNMQLNRMREVLARTLEEFLISGFVCIRTFFGWRNGKLDNWNDYVNPNNVIIDPNMRDFRGWDVGFIGEVHDISFGELCESFAKSPADYRHLSEIYHFASDRGIVSSYINEFGRSSYKNYDVLFPSDPSRCRVIEIWRKEQKPRYRCHDLMEGKVFKIDEEDYISEVRDVNEARLSQAREAGLPEDEVALIEAEWFIDNYWHNYYLTPFGDILYEGETPYEHGSFPYAFKAYPYIDGEIHSFVADVVDQNKYINRLVSLQDWIMRASAKGVLMIPKDCIPDDMTEKDFAERWVEFNGVIVYEPSKSGKEPKQVSSNSTNIGISELLSLQLKFFESISGVTSALQGRPGFSGQSAAHYNQQTENATTSLVDLLDSFNDFTEELAYKNVKNIQQYYTDKRVINIAGKGKAIVYDPEMIRDVELDISISESTSTPVFRQTVNDFLMQLFQMQAISVEQLLKHGQFDFGEELLQDIESQKQDLAAGNAPQGLSPELMARAQQGVNMGAVNQLAGAMANG